MIFIGILIGSVVGFGVAVMLTVAKLSDLQTKLGIERLKVKKYITLLDTSHRTIKYWKNLQYKKESGKIEEEEK